VLNKSKLALEVRSGAEYRHRGQRVRTKVKLQGSIQAQATTPQTDKRQGHWPESPLSKFHPHNRPVLHHQSGRCQPQSIACPCLPIAAIAWRRPTKSIDCSSAAKFNKK